MMGRGTERMMGRGTELRAVAKTVLLVLAFLLAAAAHVSAQSTRVILVRHAEKADNSADPVLSETGSARARALVTALVEEKIVAIYTTQYQRTRLTAAPLAEKLGIAATVIPATAPVTDVVARVHEHHGKTVLIVGHSNTVPVLIKALGGPDMPTIPDEEYDNLYVLTLDGGKVELTRSKY